MAVTEIPRSFLYTCDRCKAEHVQPNPAGHYTESTPPGWMTVQLYRAGKDSVMPSSPIRKRKLLCDACTPPMYEIIIRGAAKDA